MKKVLVALMVAALATAASADIILQYQFANSSLAPQVEDSRIDGGNISLSAGTITFGTSSGSTATGGLTPPTAGSVNWTVARWWEFTLNLQNQTLLDSPQPLALYFSYRCSATGPTIFEWQYSANGGQFQSLGTGSLNVNTVWQPAATISASALAGLTGTITFRLYGTGTTATGGTWYIDNVTFQGSMIPEPTTLALLGIGVAGLFMVRRRMR